MTRLDERTLRHFGEEWQAFDQADVDPAELDRLFADYFRLFPWGELAAAAAGFDLGCGSGRWAVRVAPRVGRLVCIDASPNALAVARRNLADHPNCEFLEAYADAVPLPEASMEFGYSLGVLHHLPDTRAGIATCARLLKPGAPLLLYLYYAFDNRPAWFRALWQVSNGIRLVVSRLPRPLKHAVCDGIAIAVYWPLARSGRLLERAGRPTPNLPLWAYREASLYTLRTDALDRFGTPLERRFTRAEIEALLVGEGFERITFADSLPYWCVLAYRTGPA